MMFARMKLVHLILGLTVLGIFEAPPFACNASKKYNRYLAHLFNKYGSGGTMSFEGLEHLMYNLGLGGLEFSPKHTIEEHHPNGYKIPEFILDENDDDDISAVIDNDIVKEIDHGTITRRHHETSTAELDLESITTEPEKKLKNDSSPGPNLEIIPDDIIVTEIQNEISELSTDEDKKTFREMHDPKHRHPRHHDDTNSLAAHRCLSPLSLMKLVMDSEDRGSKHIHTHTPNSKEVYRTKRHAAKHAETSVSGIENEKDIAYTATKITPITFMKICPALLVQIDQDACAKLIDEENPVHHRENYYIAWIYATVSVFIISCCGLFGVAIVPLAKSTAYNEVLKFLVAIAVGTLCGDAFMHLLPHALDSGHAKEEFNSQDNHSHNESIFLCGCAFATAIFMYTLETLLPLIKGTGEHSHGHSHGAVQHKTEEHHVDIQMENMAIAESKQKELNTMLSEEKLDKKGKQPLSPVAFMVILGDGLHNLTDGLAIGAAFASEPVTGMATAFAVLCHELPHELGDFALLIKTGVHINRAIYLNIVSSILSFIGMAVGLIVAEMQAGMVRWIYAGTAGSFLYIALADLVPELGRDGKHDIKNCLIQICGIVVGALIMLFIALHEDDLRLLFE